ncbi:MAG: hypothetical protein KC766_21650 [Myxococcales bacterium]|nr:hypothetical protein [Myxococcales bacterium]
MSDEELALPDLQDAVLSPGVLSSLLNDIEQCSELLEVRVKSRAFAHSSAAALGLTDVPSHLGAGHAVQLRYRHGGRQWLDTLMPVADGVRLVRMQAPA